MLYGDRVVTSGADWCSGPPQPRSPPLCQVGPHVDEIMTFEAEIMTFEAVIVTLGAGWRSARHSRARHRYAMWEDHAM